MSLDGNPITFPTLFGIAPETKSSFYLTVNGPGALFDDVRIWNAR